MERLNLIYVFALMAFSHAAAQQPSAPPAATAALPNAPAVAPKPADIPLQPGYKACRDVTYATVAGKPLQLDVYMLETPKDALPAVVWIHGGAWGAGDKNGWDRNELRFKELLYQGYIVVSVNYRLTYQAKFPAQIEDCKGAIRFLRANAKTYSIDPTRIGVLGTSAGGHLAALLGTSGNAKEIEGDVGGNLDQSSKVQCVIDVTGCTDLSACMESKCAEPIRRLLGGTPTEKPDLARQANPIAFVAKDSPPFLIFHPKNDFAVPLQQSESLLAALQATGVEATLNVHGNAHSWFDLAQASKFFDAHLKK